MILDRLVHLGVGQPPVSRDMGAIVPLTTVNYITAYVWNDIGRKGLES